MKHLFFIFSKTHLMAARQRLFSYTIISRRVMFGTLSGELRRATCPQVAVSPMLVLATRDVSRSYRAEGADV